MKHVTGGRLETGPHRPSEDDWMGVFIRGDNALYYAQMLRLHLDGQGGDLVRATLEGLVELLRSCRERWSDTQGSPTSTHVVPRR